MELNRTPTDLYAGYLVEDSDLEYSDCSAGGSSDDEDGSMQFRSYKSFEQREPSSSEDEFEREMAGEVMSAMKIMASPAALALKDREMKTKKASNSSPVASSSSQAGTSKEASASQEQASSKYYDEVYFDSDDSSSVEDMREADGEGGGAPAAGKRKQEGAAKKVKKLTNDELFYDPDMDDDDEKWVKRQRMAYHNVKVSERLEQKKKAKQQASKVGGSSKAPPASGLPKSDAVLNCPACMSTVCLDCQRHDTYANQYRAMFVLNCRVMRDEVLKYVPKPDKKSRKRSRAKGKQATSSGDGGGGGGGGGESSGGQNEQQQGGAEQEVVDIYHPVRCKDCNTEIAVVDSDEVFHFFNVLPSAPS